ncbi:MAG: hypothetical protein JRH01_12980 [Deltaproteobacteria bacterium]|nr:hypothetical protein [Deltaproteobacteria bacterium]MBW2393064.1 hypothetical protein [Deltaproteobacteria bacterium]
MKYERAILTRWLLLIVVALGLATEAHAERVVEVIRPAHRLAEELVPLAQTVMGEDGTATHDRSTNSLVLVGSREAVDRAKSLVQAQDRRQRSVTLYWSARDQAELAAAGVRVDWTVGGGSVRVGNVLFPENRVEVSAEILRTERERRLESSLRILDGETGRIGAGHTVPVTVRDRYGRAATDFVTGEQGFEATPRILGNGNVRVELVPIDARVDPAGNVAFAGGMMTVELQPGKTMAVGGIGQRQDAGQRGSRVLSTNQRSEERVFLLRVEVD